MVNYVEPSRREQGSRIVEAPSAIASATASAWSRREQGSRIVEAPAARPGQFRLRQSRREQGSRIVEALSASGATTSACWSRREQGSRIVEAGVPRSETRSRLPVCTGDRNMLAGRFPTGGQPSPNAARPTAAWSSFTASTASMWPQAALSVSPSWSPAQNSSASAAARLGRCGSRTLSRGSWK